MLVAKMSADDVGSGVCGLTCMHMSVCLCVCACVCVSVCVCMCVYVLCYQMNLADFSDNHWVTCFQDTAEHILGKNAEELGELKQNVSGGQLYTIGSKNM